MQKKTHNKKQFSIFKSLMQWFNRLLGRTVETEDEMDVIKEYSPIEAFLRDSDPNMAFFSKHPDFFWYALQLYYPLSETIIKQFEQYWYWEALSRNKNLPWSLAFFEHYKQNAWTWEIKKRFEKEAGYSVFYYHKESPLKNADWSHSFYELSYKKIPLKDILPVYDGNVCQLNEHQVIQLLTEMFCLYPLNKTHNVNDTVINGRIDDCKWRFRYQCLQRWANLTPTQNKSIRFCAICQRNVYACYNNKTVAKHTKQNHCVAIMNGFDYEGEMLGFIDFSYDPFLGSGDTSIGYIDDDSELDFEQK